MRLRILVFLLCSVVTSMPVWAQQVVGDPCLGPPTQPQEIASGAPFGITWTMQQMVPKNSDDPTLVPHRYNGFVLVMDGGPTMDIGMPTQPRICPNGTSRAGDKVYEHRVAGIARGQHMGQLTAWNYPYLLNPDGSYQTNPDGTPKEDTSQKQFGVTVAFPFAAVDLTDPTSGYLVRPPYGPWNVTIGRNVGVTPAAKAPVKK
jgi:hypothetical protein